MDRPSYISCRTEEGIDVNKQTIEAIKSVANKLAIIGDELSLPCDKLSSSGGNGARSCTTLEGCLDMLRLVLKT